MIEVLWDEFKTISGSMQMIELQDQYLLSINKDSFRIVCTLNKSDALEFETSFKSKTNESIGALPFASKVIGNKKLYKRIHGIRSNCTVGLNTFIFTVPYVNCKITGAEMIGGSAGDYANFKVLDTITGVVTTIPNALLNQFGFEVNISPGIYIHNSEYDADLFIGLQIKVEYYSTKDAPIGINFILNELK